MISISKAKREIMTLKKDIIKKSMGKLMANTSVIKEGNNSTNSSINIDFERI